LPQHSNSRSNRAQTRKSPVPTFTGNPTRTRGLAWRVGKNSRMQVRP
jgi:hypothetical protein